MGICVEQSLANAAYVVSGLEDMKTCLEDWFHLPSPPTKSRHDLGCMFGVDEKLVPLYWPQLDLLNRLMVLVGKYVEMFEGVATFPAGWNTITVNLYVRDELGSDGDTRSKKGLEDRLEEYQMIS